ncbi:MAG: hypothetical protein MUC85_07135 [Anaerolineales bacterium]|jgi:hypothetical protein|nr:hypothetical protein [Anaerolineales bacterium]
MRVIQTIILRLLIDSDLPQSLRGVMQVVGDSEQHSFTDEQSLLALLRRLNLTDNYATSEGECEANSIH